jgi:hypothetical protein
MGAWLTGSSSASRFSVDLYAHEGDVRDDVKGERKRGDAILTKKEQKVRTMEQSRETNPRSPESSPRGCADTWPNNSNTTKSFSTYLRNCGVTSQQI